MIGLIVSAASARAVFSSADAKAVQLDMARVINAFFI